MAGLTVPFAGTVVRVSAAAGDRVVAGAVLVVLESMKMEHVVEAATPGVIEAVLVVPGDAVQTGDVIVQMTESDGVGAAVAEDRPAAWTPRPACVPSWPSCAPEWPQRSIRDGVPPWNAGTPVGGGRRGRT